jgi:UPF0042 nucleotide-binding protein
MLGLGCTGGRHRSVYMAELVGQRYRQRGFEPAIVHRDIERA